MDIKLLKEILAIQSYSYRSELMEAYIRERCIKMGYEFVEEDGSFYIRKGMADTYPCIVAHMDTVHTLTSDLTVLQIKDNLTGFNALTMEQTGIGGDDKVGIFIAMECLDYFDNIKVVFFRDEEVGCDGSYNADMDFFFDCRFVLQCDRKGNSDFVTNASGTQLSSKAFQKAIKPIISDYGYSFKHGFMTDVMALKEMGLPCVAANISCGYYNPHSDNEYVNIPDVANCLMMVVRIMEEITGVYFHKASKPKYSYSADTDTGWGGYYDSAYKGDRKSKDVELRPKLTECECCLNYSSELTYLAAYNLMACDTCYNYENQMNEAYNLPQQQDSFSEIESKIDADIKLQRQVKQIVKELKADGVKLPKGVEELIKHDSLF